MSLNTSTISTTVNAGETATVGFSTDPHSIYYTYGPITLSDGTGTAKAQKMCQLSLTVSTGGTTIDLTACAGGPNNSSVAFTKIKSFTIENTDSTVNVIVGNAASNQWTGIVSAATTTITLGPLGGMTIVRPDSTGMAVAGGSKNVLIASSASTAVVRLVIIGEGA